MVKSLEDMMIEKMYNKEHPLYIEGQDSKAYLWKGKENKYAIVIIHDNGSILQVVDFSDMEERLEKYKTEMIFQKIQLRSINKIKKWWRGVKY